MRFQDSFVEEIRQRLRVSEVVGGRVKLKRVGSELKGLSPFGKERSPSFTVYDGDRRWHDFHADKGGDIFKFEMETTGCTFQEAVVELAKLAGVPLPEDRPRRGGANGRGDGPPPDQEGDPGPASLGAGAGVAAAATAAKQRVTRVYPYCDADGSVLYENCRIEWQQDGKARKRFGQRRPSPGEPGVFIWGLDAGDFVKVPWSPDWIKADAAEGKDWKILDRLRVDDAVAHGLYRFTELLEETCQPAAERRIVHLPEGEKDCDTLHGWDLVATHSGKFEAHHAEQLRDCDVVVLGDNDKPGRAKAHQKALLLRGVAARVRVLDWREQQPGCRDKFDVTDWRDEAGGTRAKYLAIVDRLKDWTPEPPESAFGAVRFLDLDRPARELEWLIKKVVTRGEVSIWFGPPGCGKSFLISDAGAAIARGIDWFGQRTKPGLVVYQAGEGGLGLKQRLRAYRQHHGIGREVDLPFVLLTTRVNLFIDDDDTKKLIEEIKAWAAFYAERLELVVIDTMSAASTGANENASEDVGRVLQRCHRIASETGAHVALVHHTPKAGGSPRGWSGLTGNVETAIEVFETEQQHRSERSDGSTIARKTRQFATRKQKDGESNVAWSFILKQVKLGRDNDGEDVTSCVVEQVGAQAATSTNNIPPGYVDLPDGARAVMRALQSTIERKSMQPPPGIDVPEYVKWVVNILDWRAELVNMKWPGDPINDPKSKKLEAACKKAVERTYGGQMKRPWNEPEPKGVGLIGKVDTYVWRTARKVHLVDDPPVLFPPPSRPVQRDWVDPERDKDLDSLGDEMGNKP